MPMTIATQPTTTTVFPSDYDEWTRAFELALEMLARCMQQILDAVAAMFRAALGILSEERRWMPGEDLDALVSKILASLQNHRGVDVQQLREEQLRRSRRWTAAPRAAGLADYHPPRWPVALRAYARR